MNQFMRCTRAAVMAFALTGCLSGGKDPAARAPDGPGDGDGSGPVDVIVTFKRGIGFECFTLTQDGDTSLWCRSDGSENPNLMIGSETFIRYLETSGDLTDFEVWDDTLCVTIDVYDRPYDNTSGPATYCWGEASLGMNYSGYPIIYSPPYDHSQHGSLDLAYLSEPFCGGNHGMGVMTNEGGNWLVMSDTMDEIGESASNCTLTHDDVLICPNFTLDTIAGELL